MTWIGEIAHARAGDKGNTSNVCIWVNDPLHYPALCKAMTVERLKTEFPELLLGDIVIHLLHGLHGINIVMHEALEGGVNRSLNLDGHGKSWSFLLLDLDIDLRD